MNMKKILVLGSNGMLGHGVLKTINPNKKFDIITTSRKNDEKNYFDALVSDLGDLPKCDYVINCIGVIKPNMKKSLVDAIKINSLFPHKLSEYCNSEGMKLIHITTDCVFSGTKGKYIESDLHDATDDYGKSKSLGECSDTSMVLRTSIIGEEKENFISLISWAKSQNGGNVKGFTDHLWNGITTDYFGKVCHKIISDDIHQNGIFHIFSEYDVTKAELLHLFNKKWNLELNIEEISSGSSIDRTLRTHKDFNSFLNLPGIDKMIEEL